MRGDSVRSWHSWAILSITAALAVSLFAACGSQGSGSGFGSGNDAPGAGGGGGGAGGGGSLDATTGTTPDFGDGGAVLPPKCTPRTCAQAGVNCGPIGDGCGGLLQCGTCNAPESCGAGGTSSVCGGTMACVPTTCAASSVDCGPIGDGCGGVLQCGTCTGAQTCGGGGKYSVCGGGSSPTSDAGACVPKTCAAAGSNCGPMGDGCGGLIPSCGTCTGTQICGGGGMPSKCGGLAACVPKTCAQVGATCGPAGDGCGGLLSNCGTCAYPNICGGGGTPSTCGNNGTNVDGGAPCTNLCLKQVYCSPGVSTTLTGTVYDPAGLNPLYNAVVYVPNAPVAAFTKGVACEQCGTPASGSPLVSAITGPDGKFTLTNVPVGSAIPVVIQIGRWRRQITVNVPACTTTAISATLTHLPKNKGEGDIPQMAISTGEADPFECLLLKMGIDSAEFTPSSGTGRVHYFHENGIDMSPATPAGSTLWSSLTTLDNYDIVYLPCEGNPTDHGAAARTNLVNYAAKGGRLFTTHYSYAWTQPAWPTVGSWDLDQAYLDSITGTIDTSFPKGLAFAQWLQNVSATSTLGQIALQEARHDIDLVNNPPALKWISLSPTNSGNSSSIQHMTFNTPINAGVNDAGQSLACGKVVYSDFHVSSAALSSATTFPASCLAGALSNQEKALEFMIFDLSSCIQNDTAPPVPPTCVPTTCAAKGVSCGPIGDGCGGVLQCGACTPPQTCGGGGTPGQCGGPTCAATTCAAQGANCGKIGDGCGGSLDCGSCSTNSVCGGGGPSLCGSAPCAPRTCAQGGATCGPLADGCGGLLDCGACTVPDTCGGGGSPSKCGHPQCTPRTCAEDGANCGPAADGCGGLLDCGTCKLPDTCGGAGTPSKCGSPPK